MSGDWGWKGVGDRALEYPEGGEQSAVSPPDRARTRYNTQKRQLETSVDGSPYAPGALSAAALTQTDVYIDPVNGDDENSGASPAQAIATYAEYARRVGTGIVVVSPFQTVHLLNDLPATDPIIVETIYRNGLIIEGQRTTILSGTVTSATAWDTGTSPVTPGTLEDASLPGDWSDSGPGGSSLVGKQIVMTSGANVGKTGWILADLGGKVARISQLFSSTTFGTGAPAPGDTFDVVDLTVVAGGLDVRTETGEFINITRCDLTADTPLNVEAGTVVPSDCRFEQSSTHTLVVGTCQWQSLGCLYLTSVDFTGLKSEGNYFSDSFIDARVRALNSQLNFFNICALQKAGGAFATSTAFYARANGLLNVVGALGVLDQSSGAPFALQLDRRGAMNVNAGAKAFTIGQTVGAGIGIESGCMATWADVSSASDYDFDVSGPASEWSIGGAAATSAGLGAAGSITAGNNAAAVPAAT